MSKDAPAVLLLHVVMSCTRVVTVEESRGGQRKGVC